MGIELQVPIYIVAGVLSGVCTMLIFIMAGICGQISKLKRQQRELQLASSITNASGYDNHAYNSRTITQDEELGRRGYVMYDPYNSNDSKTLQQFRNLRNSDRAQQSQSVNQNEVSNTAPVRNNDGARDATSDFSAVISTETIVMTGTDSEMKIVPTNYPPQYLGVPPPPAFVNHFSTSNESNETTETNNNDKSNVQQ